MKQAILLFVATTLALLALGCGGGGVSNQLGPSRGSVTITMTWPQATRVIPLASNVVILSPRFRTTNIGGDIPDISDVSLKKVPGVDDQILCKNSYSLPGGLSNGDSTAGGKIVQFTGTNTTISVTINNLPMSSDNVEVLLFARAFPAIDSSGSTTGTLQAAASGSVTISAGTTSHFTFTMGSTITHLRVTKGGVEFDLGSITMKADEAVALQIKAYDDTPSLVLIDPANVHWKLNSGPGLMNGSSSDVDGTDKIRLAATGSGSINLQVSSSTTPTPSQAGLFPTSVLTATVSSVSYGAAIAYQTTSAGLYIDDIDTFDPTLFALLETASNKTRTGSVGVGASAGTAYTVGGANLNNHVTSDTGSGRVATDGTNVFYGAVGSGDIFSEALSSPGTQTWDLPVTAGYKIQDVVFANSFLWVASNKSSSDPHVDKVDPSSTPNGGGNISSDNTYTVSLGGNDSVSIGAGLDVGATQKTVFYLIDTGGNVTRWNADFSTKDTSFSYSAGSAPLDVVSSGTFVYVLDNSGTTIHVLNWLGASIQDLSLSFTAARLAVDGRKIFAAGLTQSQRIEGS